jgi:hypothetical protein
MSDGEGTGTDSLLYSFSDLLIIPHVLDQPLLHLGVSRK